MVSGTSIRIQSAMTLLMLLGGRQAQTPPTTPQPELKTAHAVPVKYYLSLPPGWKPNSTWPILITIDGSGHNFLQNSRGFIQARKDTPFILVTPFVTSNGNDPGDAAAILAIAQEVQQEYHGQPKFFLTGFSAGGHVTWQIIFAHPELLAGVAPAAANFLGRGVNSYSESPERTTLPIHAFIGDKDPHLDNLNRQWSDFEQTAKAHGYANITHTVVPRAGHEAFANQIIPFFASLLASGADKGRRR